MLMIVANTGTPTNEDASVDMERDLTPALI